MASLDNAQSKPSPSTLATVNRLGWKILSWGADRHDTIEYVVSEDGLTNKVLLVVTASILDDGSTAIYAEGRRYWPDDEIDDEVVQLSTTIFDSSPGGEAVPIEAVRARCEHTLVEEMESWPESKKRLKSVSERDRDNLSGGRLTITPTQPAAPQEALKTASEIAHTHSSFSSVEIQRWTATANAELALISATGDEQLNELDKHVLSEFRGSTLLGPSRVRKVWFLYIVYVAALMILLLSALIIFLLNPRDSNWTPSLPTIVGITAAGLIIGSGLVIGREAILRVSRDGAARTERKLPSPEDELFWLEYLQRVERLQAQIRKEQAQLSLEYIGGKAAYSESVLEAATAAWAPRSALFQRAEEAAKSFSRFSRD